MGPDAVIEDITHYTDQVVPEDESWLALWDLDGTLADSSHRQEFYFAHDWDEYNSPARIADDTPYPHAIELVHQMRRNRWDIMYLTGRRDRINEITQDWLYAAGAPDTHAVLTRGDRDPDVLADFKVKVIKRVVASKLFQRVLLFDDDPEVIRLVRKNFGSDAGFLCTWYSKPAEMVRLAQG